MSIVQGEPRAIFFDIGNVMVRFDYARALESLKEHCERPELVGGREFVALKEAYEGGQSVRENFVGQMRRLIGYRESPERFVKTWQEIFVENTPMTRVIERLSAGPRLLHLSNISDLHHEYLWATYPVFHRFDGGIYSYQVKRLKPDPFIFELALSRFGLVAEEVLYLDDLPANVEAARAHGIRTWEYHHDSHSEFEDWLRSHQLNL